MARRHGELGRPGAPAKIPNLLFARPTSSEEIQVWKAKILRPTFSGDLLSTRPTFNETYFSRGIRSCRVRPTFNETYFSRGICSCCVLFKAFKRPLEGCALCGGNGGGEAVVSS